MLSHADKSKQHAIAAGRATRKHTAVAVPGVALGGEGWLHYADRLYEICAEPKRKDSEISQSGR